MTQNLRKVAVAAGLAVMAIASSANAAVAQQSSYTYEFKTFYDTSTIANLFDTKTLSYSVATLTIADISGGVQITLKENSTAFPAKNETSGTFVDGLWLNGDWGKVAAKSGVAASGGGTNPLIPLLSLPTIFKDGGYIYNGSISFAGSGIAENGTSVFTITGTSVTAYDFAKSSNVPMIELAGVGGAYNTILSGGKVSFIGTLPTAVPEPGTYALMGLGLVGMGLATRRRARRAD
jgi:hypothetical protein